MNHQLSSSRVKSRSTGTTAVIEDETSAAISPPLSVDALVLLAVSFPSIYLGELPIAAIAFTLITLYLLVDYLSGGRDITRLRRFLINLLIAMLVVVPTVGYMIRRHQTEPFQYVHDNPIQVEEAIKLLVSGKDPYGADYSQTPMIHWPYKGPQWNAANDPSPLPTWDVNPALSHVVSLPFGLLALTPLYIVFQATFGWFDARIAYLLAYLVVLWMVTTLIRHRTWQLCALILIGLNPILVPFLSEGRNDILVFSLLLGSAMAWRNKHFMLASILVGLAISTKHIAIFFLPFYALLGWTATLPFQKRVKGMLHHLLPVAITALLIILPFLLWNPQAFFDDTFRYLAGSLPTSYPMKGLGYGGLAVKLGWVPNAAAPAPTTLLQAIFAGPVLLLVLWRQMRINTIQNALMGYGLFLMPYMWFSRFFAYNYLGYILLILVIAMLWPSETIDNAEK